MAHQIYLTEGIILKKKDFGEADRLFWIYTEKFGMIMASAKGVRLEKSKLRGNLDIFTYGEYAVISSKDFWKLVDVRDLFSPKLDHSSVEQVRVFTKAANLLIRMIKGEERNEEIWRQLKNLFLKLFQENVADLPADEAGKDLKYLEIKSIAAILKTLGYMEEAPASGKGLISAINRAIKESML